jgi:hypothetical protein
VRVYHCVCRGEGVKVTHICSLWCESSVRDEITKKLSTNRLSANFRHLVRSVSNVVCTASALVVTAALILFVDLVKGWGMLTDSCVVLLARDGNPHCCPYSCR